MSYKNWDHRFLSLAKFVSDWSKDPSTKVGAVICDENNRVISVGYNGFPKNVEDDERLYNREMKYQIIVHGEINAILFANKSVKGCTLYTYPFQPCSRCASLIIQSGISRVVTLKNKCDRWKEDFDLSSKLFKESNIILEILDHD